MRVVKEIPDARFKITIYAWNNRYLIKLEQGLLEQTFKIDQFELATENDVLNILDEPFLQQALARFEQMASTLQDAKQRADI
jgi:hypothetical protein